MNFWTKLVTERSRWLSFCPRGIGRTGHIHWLYGAKGKDEKLAPDLIAESSDRCVVLHPSEPFPSTWPSPNVDTIAGHRVGGSMLFFRLLLSQGSRT